MLNYEQKRSIFRSYSDLIEKTMSHNRLNYEYPKSLQRGKILVTQLNLSGNGYVNGKYMEQETIEAKGYKVDPRGWINIKDFSETELHEVIQLAMMSMNHHKSMPRKEIRITVKNEERNVTATKEFVPEQLVYSCLHNWLGYGNMNAPIWFIGMEEDGSEIWKFKTKTLVESLKLRSQFKPQMDFRYVWEELFGIPLETFKGPNVWRYMAAFLLEYEGVEATTENINDYFYEKKQLGRVDSTHFLCEFMPLPKQTKASIEPYQSIWEVVDSYESEITDHRFELIKENLINHQEVKFLISYDTALTEKLMNYCSEDIKLISSWQLNDESFLLHRVNVTKDRYVYIFSTPFFGNGRISYNGIKDCVKRVKKLSKWIFTY